MNIFRLNFLIVITLFIICAAVCSARAQIDDTSASSVNVEELSDQQILKLMQQAQNAGLSDPAIIQQARQRGMSDDQAQKLQTRIANLRNSVAKSSQAYPDSVVSGRHLNYSLKSRDTNIMTDDLFNGLRPKVFGADIFKNKNNSFEPNLKLATPVNYVVGPNDELDISVYGKSLINWKLTVSSEGSINIPGLGVLPVAGRTIEQATSAIKNKLAANNYAVGHGTDVNVTLGNIRSIQVIMIGQLNRPGSYTLPSLATVFNALYAAGGPNYNGSLRQIEIIRNNKIIRHLDVYDFLVKGDQSNNIILQDQDIVRVPTYRTRVELVGQVKVPGLFEVLPGETLQNLITYAGGFTDSAYTSRIEVSQISDQQRKIIDIPEADFNNYIPLRGDKYTVSGIINRYENRVTITGAVYKPGEYELQKGLTLYQLIQNAAGLTPEAFRDRGTITRLKPDNSTSIISFNLKDIENKATDIPLEREDMISISSIFSLRDKYTVTINGQVRKPGDFAYADSMKVEDLILQAGGFAEGASTKRIEVARRINNADPTAKSSAAAEVFSVNVDGQMHSGQGNFVLHPFDIVSVYGLPGYEKQRTVKVEGEVLYPGSYTIKNKDEKISDLVKRAGGLTVYADAKGGSLRRKNTAILGLDKGNTDTVALLQEQMNRENRLKQAYKDSSEVASAERNDFIGIDLTRILKSPGSSIDLLLENGDVLRIPKEQQIVQVSGQVLYPSAVVFDHSKSFNDFVSNAGGYAPRALKSGAYVVYPNGTVRGTRKFLIFNVHPRVLPGSRIYVPLKPEPRSNSLQTILGLTTGLASIGAIILGIISLHK